MNTDAVPTPAVAPPECEAADPALADDWAALCAAEHQAIAARRRKVLGAVACGKQSELDLPRIGLALSGGGVRSATFALGLMRGLAGVMQWFAFVPETFAAFRSVPAWMRAGSLLLVWRPGSGLPPPIRKWPTRLPCIAFTARA